MVGRRCQYHPGSFPGRGQHGPRGRGGWLDAIRGFLERLPELLKPKEGEPVHDAKPPHEEDAKPENAAPKSSLPDLEISPPKPSDFVSQDFGKLGVGVEKPELTIGNFDPHAIEMMAERGVSLKDLQDTVDHPLIVLQQTQDKFLFLSDRGGVVVLRDGTVITTYPAANFYPRIKEILEYIHQGGRR